jgi:AraC-like DNA-binding protein
MEIELSEELDFSKMRFELPETSDRKTLEWIREEFGRRHFRVDIEPDADAPLRLSGVSRALSDFSVYHGRCSPLRSRALVDPSDGGDFIITMALAGEVSLHSHDNDLVVQPGTALIGRDNSASFLRTGPDAEFLTISVRRHLIEPLVPHFSDLTQSPCAGDPQAMRLLIGYLRMLDAEEAIDGAETRRLVTSHVQDLAALTLGATRDARAMAEQRGIRAGRLAAVKADIIGNLEDPQLSVASVAARQRLTPRYIHMLFEAEGVTFSEHVVSRRLAHAHRMLTDQRFASRMINVIALEVGFNDISYFNRTFRRKFGMTPSEAREAALKNK